MGLELFLSDPYFQRVLLVGLLVSVIASTLGVFLVLRGMSLFGNAVANTSFLGVAFAFQAGLNPLWSAMVASMGGSLIMDALRRRRLLSGDASLAVVLTGSLALAMILALGGGRVPGDVQTYLFGYFLLVTRQDLALLTVAGLVLAVLLAFAYRPFIAFTFDERQLEVQGVNTKLLALAFNLLLAVAIVLAARVVGVLLVSSLLVFPAASALQWRRGFGVTLVVSGCYAVASLLLGLSFAADYSLPTGATVAGASVVLLALTFYAFEFKLIRNRFQ